MTRQTRWREPMKYTTACRWVITLSLMSILSVVMASVPAYSQSATAPGSVGSHPGGGQEPLILPKPRDSHSDGTKRSMRPADVPDQTTAPNVRARALEERLRRGQMERPIAQSQISDWLEQLHSGSVERSTGDTVPGQSAQGIAPD
jgi:hypothetical protein